MQPKTKQFCNTHSLTFKKARECSSSFGNKLSVGHRLHENERKERKIASICMLKALPFTY